MLTSFLTSYTVVFFDPLEQFEVLSPFYSKQAGMFLHTSSLTALLAVAVLTYCVDTRSIIPTLRYYAPLASVKSTLHLLERRFFSNHLSYLFFFILVANVIGMLPYTYTVTSAFAVTLYLALSFMVGLYILTIYLSGPTFVGHFEPHGTPLALTPFLIPIEMISVSVRPFSLSVRLFANMMSGHALVKILIGFAWGALKSGSIAFALLAFVPWLLVSIVSLLEYAIAFLQAYVFLTLLVLFLAEVRHE